MHQHEYVIPVYIQIGNIRGFTRPRNTAKNNRQENNRSVLTDGERREVQVSCTPRLQG